MSIVLRLIHPKRDEVLDPTRVCRASLDAVVQYLLGSRTRMSHLLAITSSNATQQGRPKPAGTKTNGNESSRSFFEIASYDNHRVRPKKTRTVERLKPGRFTIALSIVS